MAVDINLTTFFAYARKAPFGNRLTQEQIDGISVILDAWNSAFPSGKSDLRHLAYVLATVFHETGGRMVPVREGFAKSDAAARKIVKDRAYGVEDPNTHQVYYGRGLVQITWGQNYKKLGDILGVDLLGTPDLALEPQLSAEILIEGMTKGRSGRGDFTGTSVEDHFNDKADDPVNARKIINRLDKAGLVASYHKNFLDALHAGETSTPQPAVKPEDAVADAPSLATDKTFLGAIGSVVSASGAGLLTAVNNPWALGAVALVVVFGFLLVTGRLEIRRKGGA